MGRVGTPFVNLKYNKVMFQNDVMLFFQLHNL